MNVYRGLARRGSVGLSKRLAVAVTHVPYRRPPGDGEVAALRARRRRSGTVVRLPTSVRPMHARASGAVAGLFVDFAEDGTWAFGDRFGGAT
jgi:hypothetical protein